jgi:hypothetical protein
MLQHYPKSIDILQNLLYRKITNKQIYLAIIIGLTTRFSLLSLVVWGEYREIFYSFVSFFSYFSVMNALRGNIYTLIP